MQLYCLSPMNSILQYTFRPAAVLRFSGEDHAAFLQSQATADLRGPDGLCRYSLFLDHRGILMADGFVLATGGGSMLLVSYACPAAELAARFDRHIIADDVVIEDLSSRYRIVSLTGEGLDNFLPAAGWGVPGAGRFLAGSGGYAFRGRRLGRATVDLLLPGDQSGPSGANPLDDAQAELLRISDGIPLVPADTAGPQLNPLEAGLLSAISFDKGCYLGQEVVARVHRLQRATRRLVVLRGESFPSPLPALLEQDAQAVGEVTSVAKNPDKCAALGWLKSRVADGPLQCAGAVLAAQTPACS